MVRFYFLRRKTDTEWIKHIAVFVIGLVLCATILIIIVFEKFSEGGWLTLLVTSVLISICFLIRKHYENVKNDMKILEDNLPEVDDNLHLELPELNKNDRTAVQLVGGYDGFGIHTFFSIINPTCRFSS